MSTLDERPVAPTRPAPETAPAEVDTYAAGGRTPRGAQALDEARAFYRRHFYFPSTVQADVFTIWNAGLTHMRDHNHRYVGSTAPRCYVRASTSGAGKTLLGTFVELTGGRGEVMFAPATTQWGVVRAIAEEYKTVVLDNWDECKGAKRDGQRDILLAGMYDYSSLFRSGKADDSEAYVLGPVAITAIGDKLKRSEAFKPVVERSVIVDVSKKPKDDKSTIRFDRRDPEHRARAEAIRRACEAWGRDVAPDFVTYRPTDLPVDDMDDREIDVWEPLVAVADLAGGEWPARVRRALRVLVLGEAVEADEDDDPFARLTPAERSMVEASHVLADVLDVAQRAAKEAEEELPESAPITTVELLERMAELPGGGRWKVSEGTERGRLLKARTMALSADLAMFGVTRSSIKVPVGGGEYRNGWWTADVLSRRPTDLPTFRPTDLQAHARACEEDEVPFE